MIHGSILVVCTGNICRSPVGESLLAHGLATNSVTITSAGTHAMTGNPPAPEAIEYIRRATGLDVSREGVQLTKRSAEAADLILTMTEDQRSWVARQAPRTVRRAYTMREFARVLTEAGRNQHNAFDSLASLVRWCTPLRQRANALGAANDIHDPYGGPAEGYETSFSLVDQASREITAGIANFAPGATR